MRRNPGCAVTGSVPAFTYASQSPVTRQLAGVLVEVGYIRYLAPMPPPAESTPTKVGRFHLLDRFCQVCSGVHSTTRVLHCNSGRTEIPYKNRRSPPGYFVYLRPPNIPFRTSPAAGPVHTMHRMFRSAAPAAPYPRVSGQFHTILFSHRSATDMAPVRPTHLQNAPLHGRSLPASC